MIKPSEVRPGRLYWNGHTGDRLQIRRVDAVETWVKWFFKPKVRYTVVIGRRRGYETWVHRKTFANWAFADVGPGDIRSVQLLRQKIKWGQFPRVEEEEW